MLHISSINKLWFHLDIISCSTEALQIAQSSRVAANHIFDLSQLILISPSFYKFVLLQLGQNVIKPRYSLTFDGKSRIKSAQHFTLITTDSWISTLGVASLLSYPTVPEVQELSITDHVLSVTPISHQCTVQYQRKLWTQHPRSK